MNTEGKNYINPPTSVAIKISKQYWKDQFPFCGNKFCWVHCTTFFSESKNGSKSYVFNYITGYIFNLLLLLTQISAFP